MPALPPGAGGVDYPVLSFADAAEWEDWLGRHHASAKGVWLWLAKAGSGLTSVSRADALDIALCFGWIDGQGRSLDAESWLQKFTPRGRRSIWSKRNREHVERLIQSGQMRAAGLAAIEAAKQDGRWDRAYDSPASAEVPQDLKDALTRKPEALRFFETLTSSNRYAFLHRIQTAVRPETRARRIEKFVAMLERGETL